jgi:hypothetical protein
MLPSLRRLLAYFRRNRLDDDLAEEIRLHLELRRQSLIDDGVAPAEADRAARRQFGNVTLIRERARDQWGGSLINITPKTPELSTSPHYSRRVDKSL